MNGPVYLNPALAACSLRRSGASERFSVAAPAHGGFLKLTTYVEDAEKVEEIVFRNGPFAACTAEILESLLSRQVLLEQQDAFAAPKYELPVISFSHTAPPEHVSPANSLPQVLADRVCGLPWRNPFNCCETSSILWTEDARTGVWWPAKIVAPIASSERQKTTNAPLQSQKGPTCVVTSNLPSTISCLDLNDAWQIEGTGLLENLIPADHLKSVMSYFRDLRMSGAMRLGDRDSAQRCWSHNELFARFLCIQFEDMMSRVVGVRVSSFFAHFVSYLPGSSLPVHYDKDPDAVSLSLQLSYTKSDFLVENDWMFHVKAWGKQGFLSFQPMPGDGVFFWGATQEHYRDKIPDSSCSDVLLLHYRRQSSEDQNRR